MATFIHLEKGLFHLEVNLLESQGLEKNGGSYRKRQTKTV